MSYWTDFKPKDPSIINNLHGEAWATIPGYDTRYMVSNYGRVKNTIRKRRISHRSSVVEERLLKEETIWNGYKRVKMLLDNKGTKPLVHRLVALAHIINPDKKPFVNHKNGIKSDNKIENLEWCTKSENARHAVRMGLKNAKLKPEYIPHIREMFKNGVPYGDIAAKYNVIPDTIEKVVRYKSWIL